MAGHEKPGGGVTPFLWMLFAAGGMAAALLYPIHVLLVGLAIPMGWISPPSHDHLRGLLGHPLVRLYLFVFIGLPLFHWAHRFRYTLYDGLQLRHLAVPISIFCYGTALLGSAAAAWLLWRLP